MSTLDVMAFDEHTGGDRKRHAGAPGGCCPYLQGWIGRKSDLSWGYTKNEAPKDSSDTAFVLSDGRWS